MRFPSEQLGSSGAGLAGKLGFDIAKSKVRHGGRRWAFTQCPRKCCWGSALAVGLLMLLGRSQDLGSVFTSRVVISLTDGRMLCRGLVSLT